MKNRFGFLTMFLVSLIAVCGIANALNVAVDEVKINGDVLTQTSTNKIYDFEKDQDIAVKVRVTANENINDVQIEASLRGYDHNDLMEDITNVFNMKSGVTYTKNLDIPLRLRMDQDKYKLRIRIEDRDGNTTQLDYELDVNTEEHLLVISDVILSPENEVRAGRALLASVRLRNYGEDDEKDVRVKVSVPELGMSATTIIDEIEKEGDDDDSITTEELWLDRIPLDAKTGEYMLRVEVDYHDGDEREVKEMMIRVRSTCDDDPFSCESKKETEKTIITLAADAQTAIQGGAEAVYPITITNEGAGAKTYIISAEGANWATFRVSPSNVLMVGAGESKAVNVYVAAGKDAPVGEQTFSITVHSGEKTLKEVPMKVTVAQGKTAWSTVKKGLEVGLVVLVVLLVIVGLVIGFNKLKGEEENTKEEGETYY
ncbi:putative S-layer protein [Candidatus Woesearchaeota archaeon]|nr:putative S-layer protein [Candidatus Woesearchaeota archaeon]